MGDDTIKNDWKYFLFKKKYPLWVYTIVLIVFVSLLYVWFRSSIG